MTKEKLKYMLTAQNGEVSSQFNGNVTLFDNDDDAPLITWQFHNQFKSLPVQEKLKLVNLMIAGVL